MLRELFIRLKMDSGDTEDRLKKISTEVDHAADTFKRFGVTGKASYNELAKAAGVSTEEMEKLIRKSRNEMKLDEQFRSAARSAGLTEAEINKVKNSIDRAKESSASWKNVMAGIASVGIIAFAGMFVSSGVKMAAETENLGVQLKVLMGDAEAAKNTLKELKDFSSSTNFESDQINKAGRQLLAVGVNADELIPKIRMIGDVANGSGKDFNELATIFAKNKSSNFIQGEDLNQLIEAGIPILDEFGKMFGKTALQVKEMGSKNQIEFKHLEEAFRRMTGENGKYNNMTQQLSKTSLGMWSTLSDKIKDVGKSIGTGILSLARPLLEFFTQGEQSGMRLNMALMTLALVVGVILVKATLAWAASLDVVTISAVKAYAALILPTVLLAAKLLALYLILEDIWIFIQYGPDASETYFADIMKWLGLTESELKDLFNSFQSVKKGLIEFADKVKLAFQNDTFRKILKYVLLIVGALILWKVILVGAIIYGIIFVVNKWDWLVGKMKAGWNWLINFLKKSAIILGKIIIMSIFPITALYFFRDEIKEVLESVGEWLSEIPFVQNLISQFYNLKNRISGILSGMWEGLKATFRNLLPTDTINTVIDSINWISRKLNEFSSGRVAQTLGINPLNLPMIAHIQARAMGGPIDSGQPYLVGERGPELVVPRNNGTVIPNDRLQSVGNQAPITINLNVSSNATTPKDFALDLYEAVDEVFRKNYNNLRVQLNMEPV